MKRIFIQSLKQGEFIIVCMNNLYSSTYCEIKKEKMSFLSSDFGGERSYTYSVWRPDYENGN